MEIKELESLETAIMISLFTDVRNENESVFSNPRGFWGDAIFGEKTGSQLWTLERAKKNEQTLKMYKSHAEESLRWMIDKNMVKNIEVKTFYLNDKLSLEIILLINNSKNYFKFNVGSN